VLQPADCEVQPPNVDVESQFGRQVNDVQDELLWQPMSHAHDSPQTTFRHDRSPVHPTLHGPAPQLTFLQLCKPVHVTAHDLLVVQSIPLRQALSVEHTTLQFQPAGHVINRAQAAGLTAQSTLQVFASRLHDVHWVGQASASSLAPASTAITQNPSLQVRPSAQSAVFTHANSSLWWLIVQPGTANPTTASQSATSFMACLPS